MEFVMPTVIELRREPLELGRIDGYADNFEDAHQTEEPSSVAMAVQLRTEVFDDNRTARPKGMEGSIDRTLERENVMERSGKEDGVKSLLKHSRPSNGAGVDPTGLRRLDALIAAVQSNDVQTIPRQSLGKLPCSASDFEDRSRSGRQMTTNKVVAVLGGYRDGGHCYRSSQAAREAACNELDWSNKSMLLLPAWDNVALMTIAKPFLALMFALNNLMEIQGRA